MPAWEAWYARHRAETRADWMTAAAAEVDATLQRHRAAGARLLRDRFDFSAWANDPAVIPFVER